MNESKIFSSAVAVTAEASLLTREQITRLSNADFEGAVKMLHDYGYGGGILNEGSFDIDRLFNGLLNDFILFVEDNCPDPFLQRILLNRYLYGNAKALYKFKLTGKIYPAALYGDTAELKEKIETAVYDGLPVFLQRALNSLDGLGGSDSRTVDQTLTQAMYDDDLYQARKSHNKILRRYVSGEIDFINALTALRTAAAGRDWEFGRYMLITGGSIPEGKIFEVYNGGPAALEGTYLEALYEDGKLGDLLRFEAEEDEFLLQTASMQRLEMNSISPFFAYCIRRLTEFKVVKMILTCIKNNVREEIPKRLRCIYD